jgi:hypothetical protein
MKKISILSLVAAFVLLSGCNTLRKQTDKFNLFADAHPEVLALKCVEHFPVRDSDGPTIIDSIRLADNISYFGKIDSIQAIADALRTTVKQDTNKSNPCAAVAKGYQAKINSLSDQVNILQKGYKVCIPDTVYKTKIVYRVDQAALAVANDKYAKLRDSLAIVKDQLKQSKSESAGRLKWIFILGGIIGLSILGTILKILGKI